MSEDNLMLATTTRTAFAQQVADLDMGLAFFQRMGDTGLFPDGIQSAADALMVAAAGKRFGFDPLESLQKFHVVKGRVSPSSDLRAGILLRSPMCLYLRCVPTSTECTYTTARADDPDYVHKVTYTQDDARLAGLWGKGTWAKHPKAMLRARCVSIISRMVYPDLFAGLYDADEIENFSTQPGRRAPVRHPQQHRAIEPEPIDAVFVPDSQSTDSVRAVPLNRHIRKQQQQPQQHKAVQSLQDEGDSKAPRPRLTELGFSGACGDMSIDRNLIVAWRDEAKPQDADKWAAPSGDFRRGGLVEKMRKLGRYEYARSIEPTGPAAWALFNALTRGEAGGAAIAAGADGVDVHDTMRGEWLTKYVEAQT